MKTFNSISFPAFIFFAVMCVIPWGFMVHSYGVLYQLGGVIVQLVGLIGLIGLIKMFNKKD